MENSKNSEVVVRFPPSPTGMLHIGSVRTALFNYFFAKQNGGKIILRMEDTDKERSKKEFEENIIAGFEWLNIKFDSFYRQSERTEIYKNELEKMIKEGSAYISKEEPTEEGKRTEVIRLKNPKKVITFTDMLRGEISVDPSDLGDFVIARSIDDPLYHLAVVVDDALMGITNVIRGDDGLANTPRQILIQEALGYARPAYAHIPFVLGADKSKLSKRHGALSLLEYREMGYLPEAIINFLSTLGWSTQSSHNQTDENREIFSREELVKLFDIMHVQKAPAVFNIEKLDWINREHLLKLPIEEIEIEVVKRLGEGTEVLAEIVRDRINKWGDISMLKEAGEFDFFFKEPSYEQALLLGKKGELGLEETKKHLDKILTLPLSKDPIWEYASESGRGAVLWPLRVALSGKEKSPDPFAMIRALGETKSRERISHASSIL
ncbi:MAG: glutamate--tRNA ligase [Patescibacteria group bacterium]